MKKIVLVLICVLLLTGCKDNSVKSTTSVQKIMPDLISLSEDDGNYYYVVDKKTRVVYLKYDNGHHSGITVMLKADGTPVLAEDLGIEVK